MAIIFDILKKRCSMGEDTMLVTIISDQGSAPRGTGAFMAVGGEGRLEGTIGGGMLEFQAIKRAQELLLAGKGGAVEYGLSNKKAANLGMVCGGDLEVLFSYVDAAPATQEALDTILAHLHAYRTGWLVLPLTGQGMGFYSPGGLTGLPEMPDCAQITAMKNGLFTRDGNTYYVYRLQNESRVYLFGGGHLSQETVPLLVHLGFRCVVTDDRAEFSTQDLFPAAEEVHTCNFSEMKGKFDIQPQDYIIIVTRGHVGDFEAERFALSTPAYYIGVVGSQTKIKFVNEKLRQDGFSEKDIARITTPIGLNIKSETPAEIAVSIAAQLIERRAERRGTKN